MPRLPNKSPANNPAGHFKRNLRASTQIVLPCKAVTSSVQWLSRNPTLDIHTYTANRFLFIGQPWPCIKSARASMLALARGNSAHLRAQERPRVNSPSQRKALHMLAPNQV